ncbi:hypothetical protein Sjap_004930 [Stephania japonica]|uniref:PPPDE domain-containing protein n=1 Tax=Stephania japonica TaxID=461633 RepID=A0AAP0PI92_9MAGN
MIERFYFGDHVLPCFETGILLLKQCLHQLPDAENISIAFPDDGAWKRFYKRLQHFPMLEKRDGTPKDQLSSIKQTLKELQRKREERMKEFCDIQSQIIQVHEALRVHGVEYEFGGHDSPSTGIFRGKPRECPGLTFRKSILVGRTDLGPHEVHKFMEELSKSYTGTSYNLITKNCNHFYNDSDGQNSIIIVGGLIWRGGGRCWRRGVGGCRECFGIVFLQREIPDYVNIQVAKGVKEVLVKLRSKGSALFESFDYGFPNIFINNAQDIRGQHVAFLASFSSPSVIFEQLSIIFALPRLFVASFTLVLPFFPTDSFERMEEEGDVATAFTMARILSNIPIS